MHNKNLFITGILLLIIAIFMSSCGGNKQGDTDVNLGGKVLEQDDLIVIEGESNLKPGSRLTGQVIVDNDDVFSDTSEIVDKKGNFTMEMEHHKYGDADVIVTFDFLDSLQEEEIIEHYGEGGENLEGSFVYVDDHWDVDQINKKAEVKLSLKADEDEKEHSFKEPEWGERPDDYGEPRVWFEVDEIEDDTEFFYITGKTNLLEGSVISGKYSKGSDVAETRVNPDGTFNMKIEYKYSEEPYFVIKYSPYSQWESIRDNYGFDGEKLVGSNVETSGGSQSIEEVIEYEHD